MHKIAISYHNQKLPIIKLLTHSTTLLFLFLTSFCWSQDSLVTTSDSLAPDEVTPVKTSSGIKTVINYDAEDSILFDVSQNRASLYGKAHVDYGEIILDAAIIHIDWGKKIMSATYGLDSVGNKFGIPVFNDHGDIYNIDTMAYKWDTKKAYIADVLTNQNNGWLIVDEAYKDENDILYAENSAFCPCQDSTAGTYIKSKQIKVIPNKRVYTGPFQLYVGHIPTPIVGPFGMFPATSKKSSGLIVPRYGEIPNRGFYLADGGFYWAMNDYVGIKFLGEVYTKGGWGLKMITNYKSRYHFSGALDLSFRNVIQSSDEFNKSSTKDYRIKWRHTPVSNGNKRFTADVNFATTSYNSNNELQTDQYLTNTLRSNIRYSQPIKGTPLNLSLNLRHDQNNQTGVVNFTLPDINISMQRQYPFKSRNSTKTRSKARKALETINLSYSVNAKNRITTQEPNYNWGFDVENIGDLDTGDVEFNGRNIPVLLSRSNIGIRHNIPVSGSIKLGPFSLNGSANYREIWTPKIYDYELATDSSVNVLERQGFNRAYSYNAGLNLTTRIYGHFAFKGERKKQLRHVISPTIGYGFSPDYTNFDRFTYRSTLELDSTQYNVNAYENAIFTPPTSALASSVNFSLRNTLEMKFLPKNDTTGEYKYVRLLDNFSIGSRYNFAADSLNMSKITFSANTKLFNLIDIRISGIMNPYSTIENEDGSATDINTYRWTNGEGLGFVSNLNFNAGTRIGPHTFRKAGNTPQNFSKPKFDHDLNWYLMNNPDFLWFDPSIPWSMDIRYTISNNRQEYLDNNTVQSLRFSGSFKLSQMWSFQYSSSYDFIQKDFVYPRMSIYRDLGCWEMRMSWVPFGPRASYDFYINVKSGMLKDVIRYNVKNTFYDRQ